MNSGFIATIMRLPSLSTFKISIDPSWDYVPVTIWTELELAAGFLCVSLPSIRMLLVRLLPKRLKEFLSNITHSSRSKSNPTPHQEIPIQQQQRIWKKPSSWIDISANSTYKSDGSDKGMEPLTLGSGVRGSFMSAFWNRSTAQTSQFSHLRNGSQRLESSMSNYSESDDAAIGSPYQKEMINSTFEQVEMLDVPKSHRRTGVSSRSFNNNDDENITALPQIGCIPEESYSDPNLAKGSKRPHSQRPRNEGDIV